MKKHLIISIILLVSQLVNAQYFYLPSSSQGNPNGLNTDSEYPYGSGLDTSSWNAILLGGNSNPTWSTVDSIPFPFNFNGSPVSNFKVSSSGVLTFTTSASAVPGYINSTIPDPAVPDKSIMVWGIEGTGSNDAIVTKTFGSSGAQQHWVFFSSYTSGSWTYWSIVFEEGSDKIYIVDQRHSGNANPAITAGIQIDNSNALMVAGSPTLSNLAGTDPTDADNHYYEFTYGSQNAFDMSAMEITTYPYLHINDAPFTITGIFRNLGIDTVNELKINYAVNGSNISTDSITNLNLITYENDTFNLSSLWTPSMEGTYDISMWASSINGNNDLNNSNDTIHKLLHVFDNKTQRTPMLEAFVSSTSTYSVNGNFDLATTLSNNPGNYSLLKYPMSWPSPGDPYFTNEGSQRRYYYNINTVPRLVMNGVSQNNPIGFTQQEFDDAYNLNSFLGLSAEYSIGGQTVDVSVTLNPFCNTAGVWDDLILHAAIFEHTTYNNIGSNGEVEFFNIMKKMIPDNNGTTLSALSGPGNPSVNIDLSYTFNGSYILPSDAATPTDHLIENTVEDFENLGVIIWVQDNDSKYILQSTEASLVTSINESKNPSFNVFPNPANDFIFIKSPSNFESDLTINVFDILGKKVIEQTYNKALFNNVVKLNTSNLKDGIYTIVINVNGTNPISKKINILN